MAGQDVDQLALALVPPLDTQHAGHLAQPPDPARRRLGGGADGGGGGPRRPRRADDGGAGAAGEERRRRGRLEGGEGAVEMGGGGVGVEPESGDVHGRNFDCERKRERE